MLHQHLLCVASEKTLRAAEHRRGLPHSVTAHLSTHQDPGQSHGTPSLTQESKKAKELMESKQNSSQPKLAFAWTPTELRGLAVRFWNPGYGLGAQPAPGTHNAATTRGRHVPKNPPPQRTAGLCIYHSECATTETPERKAALELWNLALLPAGMGGVLWAWG